MIVIPLIGAILALLMGGSREKLAKYVAIAFSAIELVIAVLLTLGMFGSFDSLSESFQWIHTDVFVINYALTVDGLSILMVFLTSLLVLLVNIFSLDEHRENNNYFYALIMAMEVGLIGVYTAADYFLFYIMWEVTLIPMYFMISWYGGPRRHYSAIKFFIYTHVASLVMLIGIFALGYLSVEAGPVDFSFEAVKNGIASAALGAQSLIFALLFFGFMVKMPSVPFHTWLPDAHTEAPTEGSVLLAGVMLKMGSYGIIRICIEALPNAAAYWQWLIIAIALISIIYGAYGCIAQTDLKKMVAFSSISHMGMVMLGIGCLSEAGITFAVFQMFAHGLITAMLFMVCGMTGHKVGTREIPLLGGLAGRMPMYALFMMICFMASLGLPGLVGFWGEFPVIMAFYDFILANNVIWMLLFCMLSLMLTAGYYLWAMQRTLFGPETTKIDLTHAHDVGHFEFAVLAVLSVLVAFFGVWPDAALQFLEPYTSGLIAAMGVI